MYAIHTTPGFIVSSRPSGEAGKLLSVFTKDLGLIRVIAQGTRFEKSKLRPFIQDYSLGVFSFVRGKEYWRLTNAQELHGKEELEIRDLKLGEKELVARIALLLGRLLQGEQAHIELFVTLSSFFDFVDPTNKLDAETLKTLESLIVIRILHRLGYVATIPEIKDIIVSDNIDLALLNSLKEARISLNQHINKALRESHL